MKNSLKEFDCWLSSSSYSTIYPGKRLLKISTDLKFGQRGLIACSEIKAGQCIYSIPLNDLRFILTPLRCTHLFNTRCQCFNDTEQIKITLNSIDILVAFIYHCKYTTSTECCLRNIWAPYISILPETYSDPLSCILSNYNHLYENIFIDSSNYFHSTDLNISLKRLLIRLLKSWNRIQPFINKSHTQSVYNIHKKCYSLPPNEFLWAWCTVNSRCVSCPFKESMTSVEQLCQTMFNCEQFCLNNMHISHIKDNLHDNGYTIAVIPFFDFFNHNQNVSTSMSVSKDGNTLELCIDRQISADEQVFINYGPHDNLTLFTEYGFSLPFHENDNDVIYLSFYFLMDLFVKLSTAMTSSSSSTLISSKSKHKLRDFYLENKVILEYFYSVLAKLNLPQPNNPSVVNEDDILWNSVYLSVNNHHGPSYHLSLILFLMYTFISNGYNEENHISLDNVYNISEDLIHSTIQPVLSEVYSLLLHHLEYDREKINQLQRSTDLSLSSSVVPVEMMKLSCKLENFYKEFLYYFDQRECFIKCLMINE